MLDIGAGLIAVPIAIVGFWPTYFGPMLAGTLDAKALIHIHGALQMAWLALFISQATLAASGQIASHIRVGNWLMGVGAVLVIVALMVSFESFATDIRAGDAPRGQRRLFGFLRDVVFFIPFFFVAWLYRARPEIHKRAMLVATTILLMPAVGRMRFLVEPIALWQFMLLWPIPVYIAMTHDYVHRRIIHPVYILGLVAMLAMRLVLPLRGTETWLAISAWFVGWYE